MLLLADEFNRDVDGDKMRLFEWDGSWSQLLGSEEWALVRTGRTQHFSPASISVESSGRIRTTTLVGLGKVSSKESFSRSLD